MINEIMGMIVFSGLVLMAYLWIEALLPTPKKLQKTGLGLKYNFGIEMLAIVGIFSLFYIVVYSFVINL